MDAYGEPSLKIIMIYLANFRKAGSYGLRFLRSAVVCGVKFANDSIFCEVYTANDRKSGNTAN